jgi:hypothetical protein
LSPTIATGRRTIADTEATNILEQLTRLHEASPELASELTGGPFRSVLHTLDHAVAHGSAKASPKTSRGIAVLKHGIADRMADIALGGR